MIEKGMKVFAYQVDSERTDIATVDVINNYTHTDAIDYEISAECGDCYITPYVCPVGDIEKQIRADAIEPIKAIIQESEKMMWHSSKTLKKIQEQLKEQTNENTITNSKS